jgi:predicted dithiol-disulfide oxidoreductase (DUF899 family)
MTETKYASREQWLAARLELLVQEKAASRQLAALAERRRRLPAVEIEKDYVFEGRSQLIVHQFMWLHDYDFHVSNDELITPVEDTGWS